MDVLCLRPRADFTRIGIEPPASLKIEYRDPTDPTLKASIEAASALVIPAVGPNLPPTLFENAKLRLIQVTGAGVDRLDIGAMKRLGIPVANVPGGSNSAVAEYVVTNASALLRRFAWADREIRAGRYKEFRARMVSDNLAGLDGLRAGIVGIGTIGLAVARALKAAGCKLCFYDPAPRDPAAVSELGAEQVELQTLLETSDIVTLHVPLLAATQGLIGPKQFATMKRGAILINAARGGIVDEAALVDALSAGKLGGAAVDVYSTEPPDASNPLLSATGEARERLMLTPHIAGVSLQAWQTLFRDAWDNVERVLLRGETPLNRTT